MKESFYIMDNDNEESFQLKEILPKYLRYWPWFLATIGVFLFLGYAYLRYAPVIYSSVAKIKIIDDSKELEIASDAFPFLGGGTKINLDNEIEVLKSYRLLERVVDDLELDVRYYEVGNIKTTQIYESPIRIYKLFPDDSLKTNLSFEVDFNVDPPVISDGQGSSLELDLVDNKFLSADFPFRVSIDSSVDIRQYRSREFKVEVIKKKEAVHDLIKQLEVGATNKSSEVLALKLKGERPKLSEAILNVLINEFNQDGILDRQLVSKRTLDFIDDRFVYLSEELDSIEVGKQNFKQNSNLSYIEDDASFTLQRKSKTSDETFKLENQISLSRLLKETVEKEAAYKLLPADIGLENSSINALVAGYNEMVLERDKLGVDVGGNHPTLRMLNNQLEQGKRNILNTVNVYQKQLRLSLGQLNKERDLTSAVFSRLPEKEKILRSIERQQNIKENLFLLLLQKREEAAINYAVTAPSIKVVDYAMTSNKPVSPRSLVVYLLALLLGFLLPLIVLLTYFYFDTKIHDRVDVENTNPEIPVLVEIPFLEDTSLMEVNDRSILAESFRILSTNVNYLLSQNSKENGQVIYVTSTIKGEGKTLVALNLASAYAGLQKKVLLVGADLRNPQLHSYIGVDKNALGLSNYLIDRSIPWEGFIKEYNGNPFLKVCLSGAVPPNAPQLLSSDGFDKFIRWAKSEFDYIVVDTAPTLLVTDTLMISKHADVSLFIMRADFTDKRLLEFSKELYKTKKLKNMAYVLNSVDQGKFKGYNYGYGYGYSEQQETQQWYQRIFNRKQR
ncbi:MAG: tyrosine protein kinase [Maribacter sp.]|nr:MAG: tyrosine protein kinase [Maribacter sp.]